MTELQQLVVIAFAKSNMRIDVAAREMNCHRNNILYHLQQIHDKTGLNPRNFFDLIKLYEIATKGEETE